MYFTISTYSDDLCIIILLSLLLIVVKKDAMRTKFAFITFFSQFTSFIYLCLSTILKTWLVMSLIKVNVHCLVEVFNGYKKLLLTLFLKMGNQIFMCAMQTKQ